jgi:diguanylate cyclase (GGDEF)-like protein
MIDKDSLDKLLLESIPLPMAIVDKDNILSANSAFFNFFKIKSIDDFYTQYISFEKIIIPDKLTLYVNSQDFWTQNIQKEVEKDKNFLKLKNIQDEIKYFNVTPSRIDGLFLIMDDSNSFNNNLKLENALYTNSLTGLLNRNKLISDLMAEDNLISGLASLDIRAFKEINDFYGNRTGDYVLKTIAEILNKSIKPELTVYKTASDTYSVANCGLNQIQFINNIAKLINLVDNYPFVYNGQEISAKLVGGISLSPKNNKLVTADLALHEAKKSKKDYLVFYTELDNLEEFKNNMEWTKKLKNAIKEDRIVVYYQPLINNKIMRADKFECLVRMIDGDKIISPFFFLGISKKSNQYHNITRIVLIKAFNTFKDIDASFSVNISYEDIISEGFYEFCEENIKKFGIGEKVVFEILEDEGIKDYNVLVDFINKIKKLGAKIAIDDFGTGYSNFEHIMKMNIDFLKIDASIIKYIATDKNSLQVTKTIVNFAKSLNLKVIAEYVENEDIFKIVKSLGIEYSQGYHFSAPIESPLPYIGKQL